MLVHFTDHGSTCFQGSGLNIIDPVFHLFMHLGLKDLYGRSASLFVRCTSTLYFSGARKLEPLMYTNCSALGLRQSDND